MAATDYPIVPHNTPLPEPATSLADLLRWATDMQFVVKRVYSTLAQILGSAYVAGLFDSFPNTILVDTFILDAHGVYVPGGIEIGPGVTLEIGADATLEVG